MTHTHYNKSELDTEGVYMIPLLSCFPSCCFIVFFLLDISLLFSAFGISTALLLVTLQNHGRIVFLKFLSILCAACRG